MLFWAPTKQATEQQDLKHLSNLNQATRQVFYTHHIAGNIK